MYTYDMKIAYFLEKFKTYMIYLKLIGLNNVLENFLFYALSKKKLEPIILLK